MYLKLKKTHNFGIKPYFVTISSHRIRWNLMKASRDFRRINVASFFQKHIGFFCLMIWVNLIFRFFSAVALPPLFAHLRNYILIQKREREQKVSCRKKGKGGDWVLNFAKHQFIWFPPESLNRLEFLLKVRKKSAQTFIDCVAYMLPWCCSWFQNSSWNNHQIKWLLQTKKLGWEGFLSIWSKEEIQPIKSKS